MQRVFHEFGWLTFVQFMISGLKTLSQLYSTRQEARKQKRQVEKQRKKTLKRSKRLQRARSQRKRLIA